MKKRFMLSTAAAATVAMASVASADIYNFDIGGDYNASGFSFVSDTMDASGMMIVSYGYSVDLTVYWNSGSSYENWASEARMGVGMFSVAGSPGYAWAGSISSGSGASSVGGSATFSGLTGGGSSIGYIASSSFGFVAYSTWNDGTGLAAGTITGTGWVNLEAIPAPGALALLGLAGVASRRRRK